MDPAEWETTSYACADSDFALRLYHKINAWFDARLPGQGPFLFKQSAGVIGWAL